MRPDPNLCVGVSSNGHVSTISLEDSFLIPLISSQFKENETEEKEVENLIFLRNFQKGFSRAYSLTEKLREAEK